MSYFRLNSIPLILLVLSASCNYRSHAAIMITAFESMGSIQFSGMGTLNLDGLTFESQGFADTRLWPSRSTLVMGENPPAILSVEVYSGISGPQSIGNGSSLTSQDFGDGDRFGIGFGQPDDGRLLVPLGYVSGSSLVARNVYPGSTLASLGLIPGTYQWNLPNDSITLVVVPEPNAFALIFLAGLAVALAKAFTRDLV